MSTTAPQAPRTVRKPVQPTGVERKLGNDELIVSKTDTKGRITYANRVFVRISGFSEAELLGQPHNLVRHPDMPRCVFKLLWDTIEAGREIFAYVKNMSRNGDHYWVLAHVTPTFDERGQITGYHSNRRAPARAALQEIEPIYAELLRIEQRHEDRRQGMAAATEALVDKLTAAGIDYERMVFDVIHRCEGQR
jgi:PAS domain S-box-containing protein